MPTAPRPPSADPLVALADRCVQCGLCLPVCPTYRHDAVESESPRGRIALARAWSLAALEPTAAGDAHLDHCLSCGSCEAVCPAGVEYGALLVGARAVQRNRRAARLRQRAIEWLVARPHWLAGVLAFYRLAYPVLPDSLRPLPRPSRSVDVATAQIAQIAQIAARLPDVGTTTPPVEQADLAFVHRPLGQPASATVSPKSPSIRPQVDLFVGCVADAYEPPARAALARLLDGLGVDLRCPDRQSCCGAIAAHAGDLEGASAFARRNFVAFKSARTVLTLASGCHASVRAALDANTRVVDAIDYLADHAPVLRFRAAHSRVAVHLPCTQRNRTGSVPAMRRLLAAIPGLESVELDAGFGCCGAAGTQMLDDPERAASYRAPLLRQLEQSGATLLLSANIGCRLHLQNGTRIPVLHPLEFIAAHLRERNDDTTSID